MSFQRQATPSSGRARLGHRYPGTHSLGHHAGARYYQLSASCWYGKHHPVKPDSCQTKALPVLFRVTLDRQLNTSPLGSVNHCNPEGQLLPSGHEARTTSHRLCVRSIAYKSTLIRLLLTPFRLLVTNVALTTSSSRYHNPVSYLIKVSPGASQRTIGLGQYRELAPRFDHQTDENRSYDPATLRPFTIN